MAGRRYYAFLNQNLDTTVVLSLIVFVSVIVLLFLPFWIDNLFITTRNQSISSIYYWVSLVASLFTNGIMALDSFLDLYTGDFNLDGSFTVFLIIVSNVVHDSINVLAVIPSSGANLQLFWCIWNVRDFVLVYALWIYLYVHGGEVWRESSLLTGLFLTSASITFLSRTYSGVLLAADSMWNVLNIAAVMSLFISIFVTNAKFYLKEIKGKKQMGVTQYCCFTYANTILSGLLCAFINAAIFGKKSVSDISVSYLTSYMYFVQLGTFSIAVFNKRLKEIEHAGFHRLKIERKKNFTQFVSQSIRSPLQVISLQLSFIFQRLLVEHEKILISYRRAGTASYLLLDYATTAGHADEPRRNELDEVGDIFASIKEIVSGMKCSCDQATEVLNNFLIESSETKKDASDDSRHKIPALLDDSMKLFALLGRISHISIELQYTFPHLESSFLRVNNLKIKQCIGFIVAYAIQISPRDSKILVTVSNRSSSARKISRLYSKNNSSADIVSGSMLRMEVSNRRGYTLSSEQSPTSVVHSEGFTQASEVVKKHGGDMGIQFSAEGLAMLLWMEVPMCLMPTEKTTKVYSEAKTARSSVRASMRSLLGTGSHKVNRILCVDDADDVRRLVARALVSGGIGTRVDEAADGEEAVRMIKESMDGIEAGYDLVLMDLMMPKMDGAKAISEVRAAGFTGLIFGLTGFTGASDVEKLKLAGAQEVLFKPVKIDELSRLLRIYASLSQQLKMSQQVAIAVSETANTSRRFKISWKYSLVGILVVFTIFNEYVQVWFHYVFPGKSGNVLDDDQIVKLESQVGNQSYLVAMIFAASITAYITFDIALNFYSSQTYPGLAIIAMFVPVMLSYLFASVTYTMPAKDINSMWATEQTRDLLLVVICLTYVHLTNQALGTTSYLSLVLLVSLRLLISNSYDLMAYSTRNILQAICFIAIVAVITLKTIAHYRILRTQAVWTARESCCLALEVILIVTHVGAAGVALINDIVVREVIYVYFVETISFIVVVLFSRITSLDRMFHSNVLRERRNSIHSLLQSITIPVQIMSEAVPFLRDELIKEYETTLLVNNLHTTGLNHSEQGAVVVQQNNSFKSAINDIEDLLAKDRADLSEVDRAVADVMEFINDLYTYEKLDSGLLSCALAEHPISEVVRALRSSLQTVTGQKGFHLHTRIDQKILDADAASTSGILKVDLPQLTHALANTIKFISLLLKSDNNSVTVNFEVRNALQSDYLSEMTVDDEKNLLPKSVKSLASQSFKSFKIGLAELKEPEMKDIVLRISFDVDGVPFSVVERGAERAVLLSQRFEDSLVLYICSGIIRLHGGGFAVQDRLKEEGSQEGVKARRTEKGLTFSATLPMHHVLKQVIAATRDSQSIGSSFPNGALSGAESNRVHVSPE